MTGITPAQTDALASAVTKLIRLVSLGVFAALGMLWSGCADDTSEPRPACVPETQAHCDAGSVCEYLTDGTTGCFAPLELRGRVIDTAAGDGIADAAVVALDANGAARSTVAITNADGAYRLVVPAARNVDGSLGENLAVTLRADASGYQTFPTPPRASLPIDMSDTRVEGDPAINVVENALTDVALIEREGQAQVGTIAGTVIGDSPGGVLVVALQEGRAISSAISDFEGAFTLFNVPPGSTSVTGYRAGVACDEGVVDVVAEQTSQLNLTLSTEGLATVSGTIQIVNAPGGASTSVILVPKATFDAAGNRGEAPAGLRAADVSGSFSIEGVAPGTYAVLAAFENDGLVRDPDTSIAGTSIAEVIVDGTSEEVTVPESFKITEALATSSPGADGLEVVAALPELEWADDSSEDGYEVRVYDAFGTVVYEALDIPGSSGSPTVVHTPAGLQLAPGMVYQFRAWSWRQKQGARTYISATEDLRGVFLYQP